MLEWLAMGLLGGGILKGADAVQNATDKAARKATRAVSNAPAKLGEFLDEADRARGRTPLERDYSMCAHDDEILEDYGDIVKVRCRKCGRRAGGK